MKLGFIISFLLFASLSYCQEERSKDFLKVDTIKLNRAKRVVYEINSMQLKCDTIHTFSRAVKEIFFDKNNRLRKYRWKFAYNDASHERIDFNAYYNELGELINIEYDTDNHCAGDTGYFFVDKGRIIDYDFSWNCDCCGDEQPTDEEMGIVYPNIGDELKKDFNKSWSFSSFINARDLLKVLLDENYCSGQEFEF